MKNCPCLDMEKALDIVKDNIELVEKLKTTFIGWYSRSVSAAVFVYCKDKEDNWCILASERGNGAADYKGFWNCPCGYLDFGETIRECAARECLEETGIKLNPDYIVFEGYEDSPKANRQNITFRFSFWIVDKKTTDFKFSKDKNEKDEVGRIEWIKLNELQNYKWAFDHDMRIIEIFIKD